MEEIFKKIDGYNFYHISNTGKVKSFSLKTPKLLSVLPNHKNNYMMTYLSQGGVHKAILVHRLVAIHFIPNPLNLPEVNHKDGDKSNNNDWNLEWSTRSDNEKHAYRTGLKSRPKGVKSSLAIRVGKYLNGKLIKDYPVVTEAVEEGYNRAGIYQSISTGCLHYGFSWKYLDIKKNKPRKNQRPICSFVNDKIIKVYNCTQEMVNDGLWVGNVYTCLKYPYRTYKKLYWKYA